jgi:phosphonate transport system substrate-binding protein
VLAVYNGEVDFATSYFSPPLTPNARWGFGDLPEPYSLNVDQPFVNDEGDLFVGDVRILDARDAVAETAPDIIEAVRILKISDAIPNDTMAFGPDFPEELRGEIREALVTFADENPEAWENSALGSDDGYNWSTLQEIEDSVFDSVRLQFEILGLTEEDVFEGN